MEALGTLIQKLSSPRKIVITTHVKPDADALGSSLGLSNYLIKKGHEVTVISPSDYPYFLTWMKGKLSNPTSALTAYFLGSFREVVG